ncbi:AhpC/TSA family protein [Gracilimonas mengyeensis]|uniref:AhpC/TSA family protein n=2 Tax=Gracilimonas mengyeensis TaxID=1302730 RepID=A0A521DDH9_9BACT|nr:AhpC/TSA family protein [Gracilimonas mengyeensis]
MVILVLVAIGVMGYILFQGMIEEQEVRDRTDTLPEDMQLEYLYSPHAMNQAEARPIIINYFNTGCQYCQAEIKDMHDHADLTKEAWIILVSNESSSAINEFTESFPIDTTRFSIARDYSGSVRDFFGVEVVPATMVYTTDSTLTERFKGQVRADALYSLIK